MKKEITIRPVGPSDAEAMLEIYRPYIEKTSITFEYTVPELKEWTERVDSVTRQFPWLVAECGSEIAGYAYATRHRDRIAYSWCCESSVYISESYHGMGIAKVLYEKLFEILGRQGYINVYAILTSPNPKSERFHEAFGFTDVGRFHKAGFKFDSWHDTRWMQFHLETHKIPPGKIVPFSEMKNSGVILEILK